MQSQIINSGATAAREKKGLKPGGDRSSAHLSGGEIITPLLQISKYFPKGVVAEGGNACICKVRQQQEIVGGRKKEKAKKSTLQGARLKNKGQRLNKTNYLKVGASFSVGPGRGKKKREGSEESPRKETPH